MKETESQTKLSLKLQAYQYLKTRILNCEYRPNEFLNEQKLCAEMGNISRTPMRDALGRLEQEGLITILPKKGLMVSGITEVSPSSHLPPTPIHLPSFSSLAFLVRCSIRQHAEVKVVTYRGKNRYNRR